MISCGAMRLQLKIGIDRYSGNFGLSSLSLFARSRAISPSKTMPIPFAQISVYRNVSSTTDHLEINLADVVIIELETAVEIDIIDLPGDIAVKCESAMSESNVK